jgi:hypothetical protein
MKPSPYGQGGKLTITNKFEWMQGNLFMVIHTNWSGGGMESGVSLGIYGYDSARKVCTYANYNSAGKQEIWTGTVEGDTWTWNSEAAMPGGKWRYIVQVLSPTCHSAKFEISPDGSSWSTVMDGKYTKQ